MRVLLTGKDGQVGGELVRALAGVSFVASLTALGRQELDLADADAIRALVRAAKPNLIVNAAAYTAVDRAEEERGLAFKINAEAPGVLAEEAQRVGAGLVHYSTDYVFNGEKREPYLEHDATAPLNVYGESKLAGEHAIAAHSAPYLIFRTSWVYGPRGRNFFLTMLRLAAERSELKVVNDQIGSPTSSRSIAEATVQTLASCFLPGGFVAQKGLARMQSLSGTYNMTCQGSTSWHGFAQTILSRLAPQVKVTAIPSSEYKMLAVRPAYSVMSGEKLKTTFDVVLPSWEAALAQVIRDGQFVRAAALAAGTGAR